MRRLVFGAGLVVVVVVGCSGQTRDLETRNEDTIAGNAGLGQAGGNNNGGANHSGGANDNGGGATGGADGGSAGDGGESPRTVCASCVGSCEQIARPSVSAEDGTSNSRGD